MSSESGGKSRGAKEEKTKRGEEREREREKLKGESSLIVNVPGAASRPNGLIYKQDNKNPIRFSH